MKKSEIEKENKYLKEKVRFLEKYMFDLLKEVQQLKAREDAYPWGVGGPNISPYIPAGLSPTLCQHGFVVNGVCSNCGAHVPQTSPWTLTTSGSSITFGGQTATHTIVSKKDE